MNKPQKGMVKYEYDSTGFREQLNSKKKVPFEISSPKCLSLKKGEIAFTYITRDGDLSDIRTSLNGLTDGEIASIKPIGFCGGDLTAQMTHNFEVDGYMFGGVSKIDVYQDGVIPILNRCFDDTDLSELINKTTKESTVSICERQQPVRTNDYLISYTIPINTGKPLKDVWDVLKYGVPYVEQKTPKITLRMKKVKWNDILTVDNVKNKLLLRVVQGGDVGKVITVKIIEKIPEFLLASSV